MSRFFRPLYIEGSEELSTTAANSLADLVIMGNNSECRTAARQYMINGMSEKDAMREALLDTAVGAGWDFAGGLLSGGLMGGGSSVVSNIADARNGRDNFNYKSVDGYIGKTGKDYFSDAADAYDIDGKYDALREKYSGKPDALSDIKNQYLIRSMRDGFVNMKKRAESKNAETTAAVEDYVTDSILRQADARMAYDSEDADDIEDAEFDDDTGTDADSDAGMKQKALASRVENGSDIGRAVEGSEVKDAPGAKIKASGASVAAGVTPGTSGGDVRNVSGGTQGVSGTASGKGDTVSAVSPVSPAVIQNTAASFGEKGAKLFIANYEENGGISFDDYHEDFARGYDYARSVGKLYKELSKAEVAEFEKATPRLDTAQRYAAYDAGYGSVLTKAQPENIIKTDAKDNSGTQNYTLSKNAQYGSLEIKFAEKPSDAVRAVLKDKKFKWNRSKGVWYGYGDAAEVNNALNTVYDKEINVKENTGNDGETERQQFREVDYSDGRLGRQQENADRKAPVGSSNDGKHEATVAEGRQVGRRIEQISDSDSEGRLINDEIRQKLINSTVIDGNGHPVAVYHSSANMDFSVFNKGDIGFHFGNLAQAKGRKEQKEYLSGRIIRAYLNIKNPIQVNSDIMSWKVSGVTLKLWSAGCITDVQKDAILNLCGGGVDYDSPASKMLRDILHDKGYDGIVYPNAIEGEGDSYIAFYDKQIIGREDYEVFGDKQSDHSATTKVTDGIKKQEVRSEDKPKTSIVTKKRHELLADGILDNFISKGIHLDSQQLFTLANKAFGGTMASGAYTPKDAYDAMELAVNRWLIESMKNANGDVTVAESTIDRIEELLSGLPTQTKRTEEQQQFQQFSTPPNIAYLAAWVANIDGSDTVLEPSAGIGGIASFAKAFGADSVIVNELSKRRLSYLESMDFDRVFNENAEQLNNVLPEDVKPQVVLMNPPFSSTAGRTLSNNTGNAKRHIEQALLRLEDGGRLVTILGRGMAHNSPTFSKWWDKLGETYNIRANIGINGRNYKKYGTEFDVQLVVIDKTGAQSGETLTKTISDLKEIPELLEEIRNDRQRTEIRDSDSIKRGNDRAVGSGNNIGGNPGRRSDGSIERPRGSSAGNRRGETVESTVRTGASVQYDGNTGIIEESESVGNGSGVDNRNSKLSSDVSGKSRGDGIDRPESALPLRVKPKRNVAQKNDNGVYAEYAVPELPVKGAQKHPAKIVESAAMAAVSAPIATYKPLLPSDIIKSGKISDAQLVNVVYAGQSHEKTLPDGSRRAYFIGDGTGFGKGRQISAIILDNMRHGRDKAVWVSKNMSLFNDARRDWSDIGQNKDDITMQSKFKTGTPITMNKGILFTGYNTLTKGEGDSSRLMQIVNWLGKDFDGVIAFDEAHMMKNVIGKVGARGKTAGSDMAKAGVELQSLLPNARIVYVSATGATDVGELAYATRLGLWGNGTAFNNVNDFVSKIGSSGIAAMELVARDMKAMGVYQARSISYDGVSYSTLQHNLTPMQTEIYNTMSYAWQITLKNINAALDLTNAKRNSKAVASAKSNYYSTMQRFYNQILTSMSMPSVISDIKKELSDGNSCVLQIVNTNNAEQERQLAKIKENDEDLEDLDLTPRGTLVEYLNNSFPINAYEEYSDENGTLRSRIVNDSEGKPVIDREAVKMRDKLIAEINEMSIPDGPLEMLFDSFGTDDVAEVTGRSRRIVPKADPDGVIKRVEERRSKTHTEADIQAFQDGKKHILIFSDAGGTGKSYHADLRAKNQEQRIHYLVQPGWSATMATQGFGRTHRSNQAQPPRFKLITTNIMGQKRFVSTIARRLDQLGALTKGQRETGSGMFGEKDNLESQVARDSLRIFYERIGRNLIPGISGMETLDKLGLKDKFTDEYGNFKIKDENLAREMSTFLNRILALEVEEQNTVFNEFYRIFESEYDKALENGTLDRGMENVKADKIEIIDDKVIRTDADTGAETNYVQAKIYKKPVLITNASKLGDFHTDYKGLYKLDTGDVRAVYRIADKTLSNGKVTKMYRMQSPVLSKYGAWNEETLKQRAQKIAPSDIAAEWKKEVKKTPEFIDENVHMLTGALLPIWNRLPQTGSTRAMRIKADDGTQYLGRVIPSNQIDSVLNQLGAGKRTKQTYTPEDILKRVMSGEKFYLTDDKLAFERRRVSGDWRIELTGNNLWYVARNIPGIIKEYINYNERYFIPTGDDGIAIIKKITDSNPVDRIVKSSGDSDVEHDITDGENTDDRWTVDKAPSGGKKANLTEIVELIRRKFNVVINTGHIRGKDVRGAYQNTPQTVRTKVANDLPTIAHELGHHFDKRYGLTVNMPQNIKNELTDQLSAEKKAKYTKRAWAREGVAEFVRHYLQSSETAEDLYPLFTQYFHGKLSKADINSLDEIAELTASYYAESVIERATGTVYRKEDSLPDLRTVKEKTVNKVDWFLQKFLDDNRAIYSFDKEFGSDVYKLASNAAYHDTRSAQILTGDYLFNYDASKCSDGLKTVLKGIKINNKKVYNDFGLYLIVKHGPERLNDGLRVFADDTINNVEAMNSIREELEARYPEFEAASEKLYKFIHDLGQYWLVDTGLVAQEVFDSWGERWAYYVPFNRKFADGFGSRVGKGYVNQNSPVKTARGSGRAFLNPVDGIMENVMKYVKAGTFNMVARSLADVADASDGSGLWIEKVPMPLRSTTFEMKGIKERLAEVAENKSLSAEELERTMELVNSIDDFIVQFGRGNKKGDTVTVMVDGKPVYYRVNDPLLMDSLTKMDKRELPAVLEAMRGLTMFIKSNITGNNIIWSIFSNLPRDLGTLYTYSPTKNPVRLAGAVLKSYTSMMKSARGKSDPILEEYRALGGSATSVYSADRKVAQSVRNKLKKNARYYLNPMSYISVVSDTIEVAPRLAVYRICREHFNMTPQEAYYAAMEATVDFRKGGEISRVIGTVVHFFNASVQGTYRCVRWLTASEYAGDKAKRAKTVRSRVTGLAVASIIIGGLFALLNCFDDDKREDYAQLSTYTKNNYFCIPLGDGKYFCIPKPREIAVLTSFFGAAAEKYIYGNKDAFREFYDYFTDAVLPGFINGIAQGDLNGALGGLGIIGTVASLVANKDYLGRPIVSASLEDKLPKDQYTAKTSQLAYRLGQAFNVSPQKVDYLGQAILGGFWKYQRALFPKERSEFDPSLGVYNTYVKDNMFSTDAVNVLYDRREELKQTKNSTGDISDKLAYREADYVASYYSSYYKLANADDDSEANRAIRQRVLDVIIGYNGGVSPVPYQVTALCERLGKSDNELPDKLLPSVMSTTIGVTELTGAQYADYQETYKSYYDVYMTAVFDIAAGKPDEYLLSAAKTAWTAAKIEAMWYMQDKYGISPSVSDSKSIAKQKQLEAGGVDSKEYALFRAELDEVNTVGAGITNDEAIAAIVAYSKVYPLTNEEAYWLYKSHNDKDKNNPWADKRNK